MNNENLDSIDYEHPQDQREDARRDKVIRKILGYGQIIGGAIGIVYCLAAAISGEGHVLIFAIGIVLFCISVFAGVHLMRNGDKVGSYFNLAIQIISCDFFKYSMFIDLILSFSSNADVGLAFHMENNFLFGAGIPFTYIGINLVPIAGLVYLRKLKPLNDDDQAI